MTVDLILIAILVLTIIRSCRRGFVKTIAGVLSFIGAMIGARGGTFILDGILYRRVFAPFATSFVGNFIENALCSARDTVSEVSGDTAVGAVASFIEELRSVGFPITEYADESLNELFDPETASAYAEELTQTIAHPIATTLSSVAAYILLFFLFYVILRILFRFIGAVVHMPVLNGTNRLLGLLAGIFLGSAYAYLVAQIVNMTLIALMTFGYVKNTDITYGPIFEFFTNGGLTLISALTHIGK